MNVAAPRDKPEALLELRGREAVEQKERIGEQPAPMLNLQGRFDDEEHLLIILVEVPPVRLLTGGHRTIERERDPLLEGAAAQIIEEEALVRHRTHSSAREVRFPRKPALDAIGLNSEPDRGI
jgi:hypothetical protein